MYKYIGEFGANGVPKQAVIGVPAEDLSDEAFAAAVKAGLIDPDGPTGALWERTGGDKTEKAAPPSPAATGAPRRGTGAGGEG